jgi:teichuronic acid biosynthesis glycosyltransferase TuaG
MSALVSVIMPYYKKRQYVERSIRSVLNQSYKNLELIIVYDDLMIDDLLFIKKIIAKDFRAKLIVNKKNMGVAYSRNIALKKIKGSFLAFLDADDYWNKNKIFSQLKFMKKHNILFSHTSYNIKNNNNSLKNRKAKCLLTYQELIKSCDICLSTVMISTKLSFSKFFPNLKTKEDYALWLKYAKNGIKICGYNKCLTTWRKTSGSLSSNVMQKLCDAFKIYYNFEKMSFFNSIKSTCVLSLNYLKKNI